MPVSPFDRNNYTPSAPSAPSTATASSDTGVSKSKKRRAPPPPGAAAPRDSSPGQSAVLFSLSCRSLSTGLHVGPFPLVSHASPYRLVCVLDPFCLDATNPLYASSLQVFMPVLLCLHANSFYLLVGPLLVSMPVLCWSSYRSFTSGHHASPSLLVSMPVILYWS